MRMDNIISTKYGRIRGMVFSLKEDYAFEVAFGDVPVVRVVEVWLTSIMVRFRTEQDATQDAETLQCM